MKNEYKEIAQKVYKEANNPLFFNVGMDVFFSRIKGWIVEEKTKCNILLTKNGDVYSLNFSAVNPKNGEAIEIIADDFFNLTEKELYNKIASICA